MLVFKNMFLPPVNRTGSLQDELFCRVAMTPKEGKSMSLTAVLNGMVNAKDQYRFAVLTHVLLSYSE